MPYKLWAQESALCSSHVWRAGLVGSETIFLSTQATWFSSSQAQLAPEVPQTGQGQQAGRAQTGGGTLLPLNSRPFLLVLRAQWEHYHSHFIQSCAIRGLEMTKGNMIIHSASQHTARDNQHWTKRPAEPQRNLNPRTSDANVLVLNASCRSNLYITKCPQLMEILLTDHTHQGDEGMKVTAPNGAKRSWTLT